MIQSLLFAIAHAPSYFQWLNDYQSLFPSLFLYAAVPLFLYGMVFGIWRIRFGSLLPLVLAHMILNGITLIPSLAAQYDVALMAYPKCREIDRLAKEPPEKAMPSLIALISDRDELVSAHAVETLGRRFRKEGETYLKEALASSDDRTVQQALFAIEYYRYPALKSQVRAVAWSHKECRIRVAATLALWYLGDEEGLSEIARKHPDEKVRKAAAWHKNKG